MTYTVAIVHKDDKSLNRFLNFDQKPDDDAIAAAYRKAIGTDKQGEHRLTPLASDDECWFYQARFSRLEDPESKFVQKVLEKKRKEQQFKDAQLGFTPYHQLGDWKDLYRSRHSYYFVVRYFLNVCNAYDVNRPSIEKEKEHVIWFCSMRKVPDKETGEMQVLYHIWSDRLQEFRPADKWLAVNDRSVYGTVTRLPKTEYELVQFRAWIKRTLWERK
jgi:hypothetical protein